MAIVTDRFEQLARATARGLGSSFDRIVIVPHPLGGLSQEEVCQKADEAVKSIIAAWQK